MEMKGKIINCSGFTPTNKNHVLVEVLGMENYFGNVIKIGDEVILQHPQPEPVVSEKAAQRISQRVGWLGERIELDDYAKSIVKFQIADAVEESRQEAVQECQNLVNDHLGSENLTARIIVGQLEELKKKAQ